MDKQRERVLEETLCWCAEYAVPDQMDLWLRIGERLAALRPRRRRGAARCPGWAIHATDDR
ncbi:MAG: hypothetical protein M3R38_07770 [Actinomycetota bacterium]|nr:hypothetical protein [Actinomycetota bacterium]MDP9484561.1 hypothetical protein [Actinomycetota bacterium]